MFSIAFNGTMPAAGTARRPSAQGFGAPYYFFYFAWCLPAPGCDAPYLEGLT